MRERNLKNKKMLPQDFSICFPKIVASFPKFLLKYSSWKWTERNCYLTESSSHTRKVLLDAGGHHLALPRLHLHILSCTAINVPTSVHIHSQYTECTMSNLLFERENFSACQLSHFTSVCSLPKIQSKRKKTWFWLHSLYVWAEGQAF